MLLLPGGFASLGTKLKGLFAGRSAASRESMATTPTVGAEAVA